MKANFEERNELLIKLYAENTPMEIIAEKAGLSVRGVRYVLKKLGVEMRPVGHPAKEKKKKELIAEIENSIWKPVDGYEGLYEVSNKGQVRSVERVNHNGHKYKGQILRCRAINDYLAVTLSKNGIEKQFTVHRLVATAFCGTPNEEVNHKDGNKRNNCADNLEWVTRLENIRHAHETGLVPKGKGSRSKRSSKND